MWVRDMRARRNWLPPQKLRELLVPALMRRAFSIVEGPKVLVPPERYPGEWVFVVRDEREPNPGWTQMMLREALAGTSVELCHPPIHRHPRRTP